MRNRTIKKIVTAGVLICIFGLTACSQNSKEVAVEPVKEVAEEVSETTPEDESTTEEPGAVEEVETSEETVETKDLGLEDGVYSAEFNTDSTMFHVNEVMDGKGILTVKDGKATIHIALTSKNILNLYEGTVDSLDESKLLQPTVEEITYPDGLTEEVNAFDVNVPYLNDEFDLALIGKKGVWYDHKVYVANPEPMDEGGTENKADSADDSKKVSEASDEVSVTLTGGSGKSTVESPAKVSTDKNGNQIVTIKWSSPHYDYMIVNGEKLLPVNTEGNSTFEIPVDKIPCSIDVVADTTAMSKPHEIEYNLTFK